MASSGHFPVLLLSLVLCLASSTSSASAGKVSLAVYYETLCPFCSNFIVNRLSRIFSNGLIDVVDLSLVPYGNARLDPNGSIYCQHGQDECVLNAVEACAINAWPAAQEHFGFISCVEQYVRARQYSNWNACFQKTGLNSNAISNCYNSGYGTQLELKYKAKTDALQPPHLYVPWVLVNGHPLYDDYQNFEAYICKAYDGQLPRACEELSLTTSEDRKLTKKNQFCPNNEIRSSSSYKRKPEMSVHLLN